MEADIRIQKVKESNFKGMVPFSYKKLGGEYLLVSDTGRYAILAPSQFKTLMERGVNADPGLRQLMLEKHMLLTPANATTIGIDKHRQLLAVSERTSLHILVVTGRCNLSCVYCQASADGASKKSSLDMTPLTAKRAIDIMFQSPVKNVTLEFQGGEPLLNWETVQFAIEYACEMNKQYNRQFGISLVSNFLLMTQEKIKYLAERKVSLCMSLDGPEHLHDKHRGKSYAKIVETFKLATQMYKEIYPYSLPGLLPTITKHSMPYARDIINEYLDLGICSVFIRPVTSLGNSKSKYSEIGVTTEEFEPFYHEVIDYMLELNKKGTFVRETQAGFILTKVLDRRGYRYVDLCSPCGATRGQIAYNYDGGIYPCDEARMIGKTGDKSFLLGMLGECSYPDLLTHPTCKAMTAASTLDSLPGCSICVYKPYCGVCPIYHYADTGDIFTNIYQDRRHKMLEVVFDTLFEKLKEQENGDIFSTWIRDQVHNV